jgi:hypothetical protein
LPAGDGATNSIDVDRTDFFHRLRPRRPSWRKRAHATPPSILQEFKRRRVKWQGILGAPFILKVHRLTCSDGARGDSLEPPRTRSPPAP